MPPEPSQNSLELLTEIDLHSALNRLMGNRQLLTDLLRDFGKKYVGFSSKLKHAMACNDFETARIMVHTFKGSSGTLSLINLYRNASDLEEALILQNTLLVGNELLQIDERLNSVIHWIDLLPIDPADEIKALAQQPHPQDIEPVELARLLANLSDSLVRHNLKAGKQVEEIKRLLWENSAAAIQELEIYVKKLNFNSAKICLDQIAASLGIDLY